MTDRDPSRSLKKRPNMAPPRVFLGSMVIAPGAYKGSGGLFSEALQIRLIDALMELVTLPRIEAREGAKPEDLALDITVPHYHTGTLFSRPRVAVTARLYHIDTGQTIFTDEGGEAADRAVFLLRSLLPQYLFKFKPLFSPTEMEALLLQSTTRLLTRVHSQV
ncbi:MAG: hypothetical protein NXI13_05210 [Proteobacteria bacterium]|nr:hypothetical protein [Pseudomonadota bacterium]